MKNHKIMSSRKRVLLTIACVLVAFIALGGAAFGVYAALKHSLKHQFNVKYEVGENIAAKVTAYYQFDTDEEMTEINSITFNASDAEQTENLTTAATELTLGEGKKSVRLVYVFENIGTYGFKVGATWAGMTNDALNSTNTSYKNMYIARNTYNSLEAVPAEVAAATEAPTVHLFDEGAFTLNCVYATNDMSLPTVGVMVITMTIADDSQEAYCYSTSTDGLSFALESFEK